MNDHKELLIPMLISAFFGGSTASLAAIKKNVSVGQALIAVAISSIVTSSFPWALHAAGWHWGYSALCGALFGLVIFGFLAKVDKTEKEMPDWDLTKVIPRFGGKPPANTNPKPPDQEPPAK